MYSGAATVATTCEEVVRWVLRASSSSLNDDGGVGRSDSPPPPPLGYECDEDDEATRRSRVRAEWNEGEEASSSSGERILDPSYRHDPTLLPRTTTTTDGGPNLVASELLALGSVWRLPRDAPGGSSSSGGADRFDPGCGSKPTRLDVGDADAEARPGDYFRVHFDPRR